MDPVIIVGAGPVGLALSLALAAQSVPSVVLDEGPGKEEPRPARSVVLRADMAAMVERLGCTTLRDEGVRWVGWRGMRRRQVVRHLALDLGLGGTEEWSEDPAAPATPAAPLHIPQHALARGLRDAIARQKLIRLVTDARLDTVEQDRDGVVAHTRGPAGTWWRGSHLVGCDGARSTVRKLLGIRFPGRTAVERHAVAALRTELPWPGEALLHRQPPWRGAADEITARPLPDGVWRIDWLLPPRGDLVTPDALIARIRETLAGWCEGTTPPYELIDTGVHTLHHRLARRWRVDRVLLAGDAAHLLGAVGTQGLDEGFRDVDNLAWKLAHTWHHGGSDRLLDSYQSERRAAVAHRLRAADQSLPVLRDLPSALLRKQVPERHEHPRQDGAAELEVDRDSSSGLIAVKGAIALHVPWVDGRRGGLLGNVYGRRSGHRRLDVRAGLLRGGSPLCAALLRHLTDSSSGRFSPVGYPENRLSKAAHSAC